VTHGDVVLDDTTNTSIASGDRLMEYFGMGLAGRLVFVSDVDGLLTSLDGDGRLIPLVTRKNFRKVLSIVGGSKHTDVTGGMAGKISNLMHLKAHSIIVNGHYPERVKNAILGKRDTYTKFIP
jgi:isopentenyl phosphate kinase